MRRFFFFFASSIVVVACSSSPASAPPVKRVTITAAEAWPDRGEEPAPLTAQEAADACALFVGCTWPFGPGENGSNVFGGQCAILDYAEERGIPSQTRNRWSWFARAVLSAHGDCSVIDALSDQIPPGIDCEEDGCWWPENGAAPRATCAGDVATFEWGGTKYVRDCTRSFEHCDPDSPTGCNDRRPIACDASLADRCDGDVKLGCDHTGKVSFHDCTRVREHCVETSDGAACTGAASQCDWQFDTTCSDDHTLHACYRGAFVDVDCTSLGFSGCTNAHCAK